MARHHRKSPSRICHFVTCFLLLPIIIILLGLSLATDNWYFITVDRNLFSLEQLKITSDVKNYEQSRIAYNRTVGMFRECYRGKFPAFLKSNNGNCHSVNYTIPTEKQDKQLTLELWQYLQLRRTQLSCMILALFFCSITFIFGVCVWKYEHHCIGIFACLFIVFTAFMINLAMTAFHAMEFIETNTVKDKDEIYYQKNWPLFIKDASTRSYGDCYVMTWCAMAFCLIPAFLFGLVSFQFKAEHYNRLRDNYEYNQTSDISTIMKSSTNYSPVTFGQKNNNYNDNIIIYEGHNNFQELEGKYVKS